MSFILVPKHGEDVQINAWNWRPTLELLLEENLISHENYERMGAQGVGGHVDAETADRIAYVIERILMTMKSGERMLPDLTFTAKPKTKWVITPETKPDELDPVDFYSASYEWLVTFAEFCRRSGGFEIW
ncbi:MAG: hypothetical protein H7Z38_03560 [Rubrivivax sp.]|nr:hypothetical protein [Pyrinomonadaceae bacterium]